MIKLKSVTPRFNKVITTMRRYTDDDFKGLIKDYRYVINSVKEFQTVLAIGPMVRDIKVGDIVMINPTRYTKMKHEDGSLKDGVISDNMTVSYNFPTIDLNGEECLAITDQDIDYIIDDFEVVEEEKSDIYIPPKKDIIV